MKELSSIQSHVWNVQYDFTDLMLTDEGGISFISHLAKTSGLVGMLEGLNGTLKKRRCGATEAQSLLAQVYMLAKSKGHLSDFDDARQDPVFRVLTGLGEMPGSRRMGEFLFRFREPDLVRLRGLAVCSMGFRRVLHVVIVRTKVLFRRS